MSGPRFIGQESQVLGSTLEWLLHARDRHSVLRAPLTACRPRVAWPLAGLPPHRRRHLRFRIAGAGAASCLGPGGGAASTWLLAHSSERSMKLTSARSCRRRASDTATVGCGTRPSNCASRRLRPNGVGVLPHCRSMAGLARSVRMFRAATNMASTARSACRPVRAST